MKRKIFSAIKIIAYLFAYFLLFIVLEILSETNIVLSALLTLLVYGLFILPFIFRKKEYFKIKRIGFKWGGIYTASLFLLVVLGDILYYDLNTEFSINHNHLISIPYLLSYVILSPALEELVFRVITLEYFFEKKLNIIFGIILSAFFYSLSHDVTSLDTLILFALGLILGAIYSHSRNLWVAIGLHALYNLLVPLIVFTET